MQPVFLNQLINTVGSQYVLTEKATDRYCTDQRKRYRADTLAVVKPANTQEIADVVHVCAQHHVAIVPQGGNTSLVGGSVPLANHNNIVLNLQRLNTIRHVDKANQTMTVEAGCILQHAQAVAQNAGFLFPLSMASQGSCTIGGNLASNAGGTQVLRYGNARALCLGLEVVTAQGEVLDDLHGLRKNNTGYDLRHLMLGSEGTLGIITAAVLKLFPQPKNCITTWVSVPNVDFAVQLLQLAQQHLGSSLTAFELMQAYPLQLVAKHFTQWSIPALQQDDNTCYVLLESSDQYEASLARARVEHFLQTALEQDLVVDAVLAKNLSDAHHLWQIREHIPLAQAQEGLNVKHDIAIPISRIPAFIHSIEAALQTYLQGVRVVCFGHLGDGNLHYNIQSPPNMDAAKFLQQHEAAINRLVYDAVYQHGGTMSAEHGIGQLKVAELQRYKSPVALQMMHAIKLALDPDNILNPNRIIDTET